MGIFSNSDQSHQDTRSNSATTIITAGTEIKGEIKLSCNLYIDGYFEGNVTSKKEVNIGKEGKIKGEIKALRVVIQGLMEGSIDATRVDIKPDGKVIGSILSQEFVIEAKGIFEGNSSVKKPEKEPKKDDYQIKKDLPNTSSTQLDKDLHKKS